MNRRQVLALSTSTALGNILAGCSSSQTESFPETPTPPVRPAHRIAYGTTGFALELIEHTTESTPNENLLISPYSIAVALAMTFAGARGETRRQMRETLNFDVNNESLHTALDEIHRSLQTRETVPSFQPRTPEDHTQSGTEQAPFTPFELIDANALWGQVGLPYRESFLELLEAHYGAGLRTVDFIAQPEAARNEVNEWVRERTQGKITDLLPEDSITVLTRLVLANAVYFKSKWDKGFVVEDTAGRRFTALDGSENEVPMMTQSEWFPYIRVRGHQVIELPYVAKDLGMVVILPAEGRFEEFQDSLTVDRLRGLLQAMEKQNGTITIPKFSFESAFGLKQALSALGMPVAFSREANFRGMIEGDGSERLLIDDVYHKTFIGVDERGTEAAAATGVALRTVTAPEPPDDPFEMIVDRPFLFLIRDARTEAILFFGRVVDAAQA